MKHARLLFPLMFVLALSATAFTQRASSHSKRDMTVYYEDELQHTCVVYIEDIGNYMPVWQQNGLGMNCFQPFYSYIEMP